MFNGKYSCGINRLFAPSVFDHVLDLHIPPLSTETRLPSHVAVISTKIHYSWSESKKFLVYFINVLD